MLSIYQLRTYFKEHQLKLHLGDEMPSISEMARRAEVHRDTIYSLIDGNRINLQSQLHLSKVVEEMQVEPSKGSISKIMNLSITSSGVKIGFGIGFGNNSFFRKRLGD